MRAHTPAQRGHQISRDHIGEDAGDGILAVEELLERLTSQHQSVTAPA